MKSGFDVDQFKQKMGDVFRDYRSLNKRAGPVILRNRAIAFAIGSGKGARYRGLFQEARALRSSVVAEIKALPQKLDWRIKRPKGFTVSQEIATRLVQAGYFQASGWLVPGLTDITGEGSNLKTVRGKVLFRGSENHLSVTLTNTSPRALEYAKRTGYMARVFYNQTQDMLVYIKAHLNLTAAEFSKKYPNFRQPIEEFLI